MTLRLAIVEDEAPARARLRRLLAELADVEVVLEADTLTTALAALPGAHVDALFLDIALGESTGFDLLDQLPPPWPLLVFATAYHEHALRAFEVAAVDYLLKPFDAPRLAATLERLRARLADADPLPAEEDLRRLQAAMPAPAFNPPPLVITERGQRVVVPLDEVTHLVGSGNYVELHTPQRSYLMRATLTQLATQLHPAQFLRVHRSHLVRADQITALTPRGHGDAELTLRDGTTVMVSRRYRETLPEGLRGR
ncbi:MAG: LytTR family DNA-binding domain-containing protein [Xanthomonadaceae bacterium]|nr:LytTR family DNA-binding domain-containing protein [Xanthomonadaceae bacterium]